MLWTPSQLPEVEADLVEQAVVVAALEVVMVADANVFFRTIAFFFSFPLFFNQIYNLTIKKILQHYNF